jgi:hypothetical protein
MDLLRRDVIDRILASESGVGAELANQLRTKLGLGAGQDTSAVKPTEQVMNQGRPTQHIPYKGSSTNTNSASGTNQSKIISTPVPN